MLKRNAAHMCVSRNEINNLTIMLQDYSAGVQRVYDKFEESCQFIQTLLDTLTSAQRNQVVPAFEKLKSWENGKN